MFIYRNNYSPVHHQTMPVTNTPTINKRIKHEGRSIKSNKKTESTSAIKYYIGKRIGLTGQTTIVLRSQIFDLHYQKKECEKSPTTNESETL